jgi:hypothetical protein
MAMQVEGPDKGREQLPAVGRGCVHGIGIATRAVSDHKSFWLHRTLDGSRNWSFESVEPKCHDVPRNA